MSKEKGLIFDIQSFSVHDGPGCRTTCFMAGCFLKCEWCANPESWTCKKHLMYSKTKCKHEQGCNRCIKACDKNAISFNENNELILDWKKCSACDALACTIPCYHEALRICGKDYSVEELIKVLNRDRQFWGDRGGVTFSGGEPFYQKEFLLKILKKCRECYIHTAIETTAYVDTRDFLEIMKYVDFAFIDVKHMDREKHYDKTGVYNDLILKNIEALKSSNWNGRLVLRMPVIENYNDTNENILETVDFMKKHDLVEINILPFHRLGDSKWTQLGREYSYKNEEATSEEKLLGIQDVFLENDIACYVANETLF